MINFSPRIAEFLQSYEKVKADVQYRRAQLWYQENDPFYFAIPVWMQKGNQ